MRHFFTLIFAISAVFCTAQTYKTDIDFGGGFVFTTFFEYSSKQDHFLLTSPKNTDKRALGSFKSTLGRMFHKLPKKGIFVVAKGTQKGDSLTGIAGIPVSGFGNGDLSRLTFKGHIKETELNGKLLKDSTIVATIKGFKTNETKIDYGNLYPKMMEITQKNIFSEQVLQTKEWKHFQKKFKRLSDKAKDDIDVFLGFLLLSQKLPFSHYYLMMKENEPKTDKPETDEPETIKPEKSVIFEEKSTETAYLKIKNFSTSKDQIAETFPKIINNPKYKNLIVDLRGNGGGGIEAAYEFGKHVFGSELEVGYFITNQFKSAPDIKNFATLPVAKAQTTDDFLKELQNGKGVKMIFPKSENPVFKGKIYVLIDKNVASTSEPVAYVLKNKLGAVLIGENTAGAMLSGTLFDISGKYKLFLPIADFYTYDGIRLEKLGVAPNIATKPEAALDKALELISGK